MAHMLSTTLDRRACCGIAAALPQAPLPLLGVACRICECPVRAPARRVFFENPDYVKREAEPRRRVSRLRGAGRSRSQSLDSASGESERGKPLTRVRDRNISIDIHWAHTEPARRHAW